MRKSTTGMVVGQAVLMANMAAAGSGPVATVSSEAGFELRGASVAVEGVPYYAVTPGDTIGTHSAPAVLKFRDGSVVVLAAKSTAKVETTESGVVMRLLTGSMQVQLGDNPTLSVFNNTQAVPASQLSAAVATTGVDPTLSVRAPRAPAPPKKISAR